MIGYLKRQVIRTDLNEVFAINTVRKRHAQEFIYENSRSKIIDFLDRYEE
jgi:hypothetical protein